MKRLLKTTLFSFITVLAGTSLAAFPGEAQSPTESSQDPRNVWPKPVADAENFSLTIFDLLEYDSGENGSLTWDAVAWRGGDIHRLWIKSEGSYGLATPNAGEGDFQLLYGRLVTAFFDAQVGARYEQAWGRNRRASRISAALGLQGISLYVFELETSFFIGDAGHLSGRITASKDFLLTQKSIAQFRFETNVAAKHSDEFETGAGVNDLALGLRLRHEFKREFAPYLGVSWTNIFGQTANFRKRSGGETSNWDAVAGVRLWY